MPVTKSSLKRCGIIDAMLSDGSHGHTIAELKQACENELGYSITRATIYSDLRMLKTTWNVALSKTDTRPQRYYYEPNSRTMTGQVVSSSSYKELIGLVDAIKSAGNLFDTGSLVEQICGKLEKVGSNVKKFIEFSDDTPINHNDRLWKLYEHIVNGESLYLNYKTSYNKEARLFQVQPFYLKQYKSDWYLMVWCYDDRDEEHNSPDGKLITLALDRIVDFKLDRERKTAQKKENDIDFGEYFADVVGIIKYPESEKQTIVLRADLSSPGGYYDWKRMDAKPIHRSQQSYTEQKTLDPEDGEWGYITLSVYPNPELFVELRRYTNFKIISPKSVQEEFLRSVQMILSNYSLHMASDIPVIIDE